MNELRDRKILFQIEKGLQEFGIAMKEELFYFTCYKPNEKELKEPPKSYLHYIEKEEKLEWNWDVRAWINGIKEGDFNAIESLFSKKCIESTSFYKTLHGQRELIVKMYGKTLYDNFIHYHFSILYNNLSSLIYKAEENRENQAIDSINKLFIKMYRILDCIERYALNELEAFEQALYYKERLEDQIAVQLMNDVLHQKFSDSIFSPFNLQQIILDKKNKVLSYEPLFEKLIPTPSFLEKFTDECRSMLFAKPKEGHI